MAALLKRTQSTGTVDSQGAHHNRNGMDIDVIKPSKTNVRKEYTALLVKGGEFTKLSLMGAVKKQRRLWCSKDLKKIYWGSAKDTKRGNIKGYASTRDLVSVTDTIDTRLLCLKFSKKKVELRASSTEELDKWVKVYNWLLKYAKRGGFNTRGSVMKRSSWAITALSDDAESIYEIMIKLLQGSPATVYIKDEEPRNVYIWVSFLLNEICYGIDVTARGETKKSTKGISINSIVKDCEVGDDKYIDEGDSDKLEPEETISSFNPMNKTSVLFSLKNDVKLSFAFHEKPVAHNWITGVNYIRSMNQLEKEDFYWYYCSLHEGAIRCARGCVEMDDSLLRE